MKTKTEVEKKSILEQFDRDGYYLAKGVYKNELSALEESFDRIVDQLKSSEEQIFTTWVGAELDRIKKEHENKANRLQIIHTHNVQRYDSIWMKAFYHELFLDYSRAILGEDIVLHHSKLFLKPAKFGGAFPMHQDYSYFSTVKDTMIAGVIHLSEGGDQSGGIRVYPGSHKLGRLPSSNGQALNQMLLKDYPIENSIALDIEPGDVLFFHYFTLHGSMPNLSDSPRKTVLVQMYNGADKLENENAHTDERIVLSGWNHCMTRNLASS